jgi:hypothetical protein
MDVQQLESRMVGHEPTVRSFGTISHRFLAKRASSDRIRQPLPCIRRLSSPFGMNASNYLSKRGPRQVARAASIFVHHTPETGIAA